MIPRFSLVNLLDIIVIQKFIKPRATLNENKLPLIFRSRKSLSHASFPVSKCQRCVFLLLNQREKHFRLFSNFCDKCAISFGESSRRECHLISLSVEFWKKNGGGKLRLKTFSIYMTTILANRLHPFLLRNITINMGTLREVNGCIH